MSSDAVASIVNATLDAHWNAALARRREPNTDFDPGGLQWFEVRFPGSHIGRGDIGEPAAPLRDETGAFMVDVYVPKGTGDQLARNIADAIWEIFAFKDLSGLRCDERMAGQSGWREPEGVPGVWWGLSYGIGYRYLSI
ncbi:hypothetical protein FHS78_000615 [Parvibaculum indicum]|uniref:phage tail terminator-like protein n=1 Tax=Parvibaculum indicum TaxID=562969 RepID=UPI0014223D04|nr:phage tail terminator-like protein [Parvibaculum indicum]NIJ40345.1 hypothetical protein [Parvibaculum indicum]